MSKKKTQKEYIAEVAIKNPDIRVDGQYIDANTSIQHFCMKHNVSWNAVPRNILHGSGCPECRKEKNRNKRMKTHNEYVNELKRVNPFVSVIESYAGTNTPINHLHPCGHITKMRPYVALRGAGCVICAKKNVGENFLKSHEEFISEMAIIHPDITITSQYVNSQTKIGCRCEICGHSWSTKPSHLSSGHGCPMCGFNKISNERRKPQEQFEKELNEINSYIKIISSYTTCHDKITCECLLCGYKWENTPGHLLRGEGCPVCTISTGERNIRQYLDKHCIKFLAQYKFDDLVGVNGGKLSYDFYLPLHYTLIEFQGEQHERPVDFFGGKEKFKDQQEHDRRKKTYALSHGYNFLEISYKDINNVDDILNNFFNNLKSETVETTGVV